MGLTSTGVEGEGTAQKRRLVSKRGRQRCRSEFGLPFRKAAIGGGHSTKRRGPKSARGGSSLCSLEAASGDYRGPNRGDLQKGVVSSSLVPALQAIGAGWAAYSEKRQWMPKAVPAIIDRRLELPNDVKAKRLVSIVECKSHGRNAGDSLRQKR